MNVLIYDGPGVSQSSLQNLHTTLHALLTPSYTIQRIKPHTLATQPWSSNCALFVLPGGRDIPYLTALGGVVNEEIRSYVRKGGRYLGACAGAYYACARVEWEVGTDREVVGERPLGFFSGIGRGCVYPGFEYENENGARVVRVSERTDENDRKDELIEGVYYNGGGYFVDAENAPNASILAHYLDGEGEGKVAAVSCRVGEGTAVLWMVHPEFSLSRPPASCAPPLCHEHIPEGWLRRMEEQRLAFVRRSLTILGLELPSSGVHYTHPLPQFLIYPEGCTTVLGAMLEGSSGPCRVDGGKDTFEVHELSEYDEVMNTLQPSLAESQTGHIFLCPDGTSPLKELTPHFDVSRYFNYLETFKAGRDKPTTEYRQQIGEALLYGEVINSTQTQLDQNPLLAPLFPIPLTSLASFQLAGRGRGSNTWLSPPGSLLFSLLLRLPLSSFPASKLVFVQYVFALAVAEACRSDGLLGRVGESVRLKWPNDVYALDEGSGGSWRKVGGVLVTTSFGDGQVLVNIGCGLNVCTRNPLFSLSQLAENAHASVGLGVEKAAAAILSTFEPMWDTFVSSRGSFDPFMDLYLSRWLHSDQTVTLTTTDPPTTVTIVGITPDYGFLRTIPTQTYASRWSTRGEQFIDLQPDGNSFDMMAELIRVKDK